MKCCGLIWGIMAGLAFSACLGPRSASTATGGEVTGVGGTAYSEPTPYGTVSYTHLTLPTTSRV